MDGAGLLLNLFSKKFDDQKVKNNFIVPECKLGSIVNHIYFSGLLLRCPYKFYIGVDRMTQIERGLIV